MSADGFYPIPARRDRPSVVGKLRTRPHVCSPWVGLGVTQPGTVARYPCGRRFYLKPITLTQNEWVRYRWWHGRIDTSDVWPRSNGVCTFMGPRPEAWPADAPMPDPITMNLPEENP